MTHLRFVVGALAAGPLKRLLQTVWFVAGTSLAFLLLLTLAACQSEQAPEPGTIRYETIARDCEAWFGDESEQPPPVVLLVTSPAGVKQVAERLPAAVADELQQVDYEESFVLVAFLGYQSQSYGGCGIERIVADGSQLRVETEYQTPPGADGMDVVTTPYEVVAVTKPVGFDARESLALTMTIDGEEVLAETVMLDAYAVASVAPHAIFAPMVVSATGTATATPSPFCTPPACAADEVYYCPGDCVGGCGTVCATVTPPPTAEMSKTFSGERSMGFLQEQMDFGPRYPGSPGHQEVGDYIVRELQELGWAVEVQEVPYQGISGRNFIARANSEEESIIILGAHYDTRRIADQSELPEDRDEPVPGAVDGASGVAVLLELARTLDLEEVPAEVWLTFFDLEDNGSSGIEGWDWIVGSTYMAENLTVTPEAMVLVDMIGDADQQLYYEGNSDDALQARLWEIAAELGYEEQFIPEQRYTMIDDHVPFARRGIPAVDIIDFDYPYWHTVEDTADKASADSLLRVGRTLEEWLEHYLE